MHRIYPYLILFLLIILTGCGGNTTIKPHDKENVLLTVDFQQGKTLRYEFVSERQITITWNTSESSGNNGEPISNISTEKLDLIMAYTPDKIDPYGLTTIKADCQAAKVSRYGGTQGNLGRNENAQKDAGGIFYG